MDPRITKLAYNLINYSCRLKKGEKVLIEANGIPDEMICELVKETYKVGAYPFVQLSNSKIKRELLNGASEEMLKSWANYDAYRMKDMDAYIGLRGGLNPFELSDVDAKNMALFDKLYGTPVHSDIRVAKTKWVILRWPTESMAQQARMSTSAFEDFYFNVCNLDYSKMDKAMDNLEKLMKETDKVHIVGPGDTDLTFSIKNIGAIKCSGQCNIPDGEVYSAPVKNSVNGVIHYNTPTIENGMEFKNIRLVFKDGKIIEATGSNTEELNKIFDTDEGARYVGEFAFGVNPYVKEPTGDILFDEKINGSIHFTPGCCYEDCDNGNKSAIHWDLVLIQRPEYGGGKIYMDDRLIRDNGRFVIPELECLNPENLI